MKHRNARQDVIRELVRSESIRTQRDLVDMLKDRGFACTQATVSRDTAEMDLQKLPEAPMCFLRYAFAKNALRVVVGATAAENLIVIRCHPGTASAVAFALDDVELDHVVGTVAGDDTVLMIVDKTAHAADVVRIITQLGNVDSIF